MRIRKTTNFDQFILIQENRPVDWNRVEAMSEEMKKRNLTDGYPVIVNSKEAGKKKFGECDGTKYPVIDGQHRYLASHLSDTAMHFIVNDDFTIDHIPAAAAFQKSWQLGDYLHHYCERGASEYKAFAGYMDRNGFSPATTLVVLCGDRNRHTSASFKSGNLKIVKTWSDAIKFADCVNEMHQYLPFAKHSRFVEAFLEVFNTDNYTHSKLMGKLDYMSGKFRRCADRNSYLEEFEKLYNYNSHDKIYFKN